MTENQKPSLIAATLAVGTEIADGQVLDRNSAWISERLVLAGVKVIEHRAVADEACDIERALIELSERVDLLFVTGGLGPTSDDFTRDILAKCFALELEFHAPSWTQITERLRSRGVAVREVQKKQCFYPKSSLVLENPIGTANGFCFETHLPWRAAKSVKVYALPGPPTEIAAVWESSLGRDIEGLVPGSQREQLVIFRCLGRPESEVAEKTEAAIAGSGIRVGYRAHLPYVEVKLWISPDKRAQHIAVVKRVEKELGEWVTNRDKEDLADQFLDLLIAANHEAHLADSATDGWLAERLLQRIRERKLLSSQLKIVIETRLGHGVELLVPPEIVADSGSKRRRLWIGLSFQETRQTWEISLKQGANPKSQLEVRPPRNYNVGNERARKYITEMALKALVDELTGPHALSTLST